MFNWSNDPTNDSTGREMSANRSHVIVTVQWKRNVGHLGHWLQFNDFKTKLIDFSRAFYIRDFFVDDRIYDKNDPSGTKKFSKRKDEGLGGSVPRELYNQSILFPSVYVNTFMFVYFVFLQTFCSLLSFLTSYKISATQSPFFSSSLLRFFFILLFRRIRMQFAPIDTTLLPGFYDVVKIWLVLVYTHI